jgi:hypothetical protein
VYGRGISSLELIAHHRPPPDPDPNVLWNQPSPLMCPPAYEVPDQERFAVAYPNPNAHTLSDFYRPALHTELEPGPYYTPSVNLQDSGPMSTTQQPFATLDAGRTLICNDFQGYSPPVRKCLQSRVCIARLRTYQYRP